jgi:hypothetical protein
MKKDAKYVIGCFAFLYLMAFLFIAMAWFGVPIGENNHGLDVVFNRNLIYTTGKVIRFDSFHMSRSSSSTPVVEIPVGKTLFRFKSSRGDHRTAYPPALRSFARRL